MTKTDHMLMLKSKSFYQLEKRKGLSINLAGFMFSEEESISGWINRTEDIIKMKMPNNFDELEKYNEGHIMWMLMLLMQKSKHFITVLFSFLKKLK